MELPGEAPLGIFCSCTAATLPYAAIPLAAHEVIELPDAPGALQVGGSSNKLHLLLGDYIAVYKGRPVPILMYGFPEECEGNQLNIGCSVFFLCLFLCFFLFIKNFKNRSIVDIHGSVSFRYANSDVTILYIKQCLPR